MKDVFRGFLIILIVVLLALSLRIFFFSSFKIPSPSMVPAIESGDYIFVNKLIPGPRVYKNTNFMKGNKIETQRFKGYRSIRRNDVLVFNFPCSFDRSKIKMNININYVKRCIAIPGDTFYIDNGIYKVKNCSDTLGYYPYQKQLSERPDTDFTPMIFHCFPYDSRSYNWNVKNFGPLYVPKSGDQIRIDTLNIWLYKKLIEYETDKTIILKDGVVYLDEMLLKKYVFNQNYYFMSGDWVFDSLDSRYWGLLPEEHIVGKATFIWQSKDINTGKYKWKRFLKQVK